MDIREFFFLFSLFPSTTALHGTNRFGARGNEPLRKQDLLVFILQAYLHREEEIETIGNDTGTRQRL